MKSPVGKKSEWRKAWPHTRISKPSLREHIGIALAPQFKVTFNGSGRACMCMWVRFFVTVGRGDWLWSRLTSCHVTVAVLHEFSQWKISGWNSTRLCYDFNVTELSPYGVKRRWFGNHYGIFQVPSSSWECQGHRAKHGCSAVFHCRKRKLPAYLTSVHRTYQSFLMVSQLCSSSWLGSTLFRPSRFIWIRSVSQANMSVSAYGRQANSGRSTSGTHNSHRTRPSSISHIFVPPLYSPTLVPAASATCRRGTRYLNSNTLNQRITANIIYDVQDSSPFCLFHSHCLVSVLLAFQFHTNFFSFFLLNSSPVVSPFFFLYFLLARKLSSAINTM